jgi:hypothetical protein
MSWTVACFCGHTFTAPPGRCGACGTTLTDAAPSRRHPRPVRATR